MMVSDEEKRWLVVGIAMNKVAAPVLRDFIKQGMDTHYTNNTYCHGLASPCALNTLTYHYVNADPNLRKLKFQNINNNHNHGDHKNLYNYSINSSVDLAKLFLPNYLAEFSGFDESLDMSAILRLLGCNNPAPIFHSSKPSISIQLSADDVRENVRNTWGHCNVTDWTEVFFNDCFSKLETLVRSLGLTSVTEKMALDQLSDWETKGCQLCMGHAVDQNLLSFVQQDVKGLVKIYKTTEESLAQQRVELTEMQDQQSATRAQLEGHDDQLTAVLEWKEQQMKENKEILLKLMSVEKMLTEELLIRVEGVERRLTETDEKVEQLQQGFAKTDDKVEQLQQGFAKTDDKVEQLQQGFTKTDDKVEQLQQGFTKTDDKVEQLQQGFAKTDDKVEQLHQGFSKIDDKVEQLQQGFTKTDDKVEQLQQGFAKTDDKVEQLEQEFAKVKQLEEAVSSQRMKENRPGSPGHGSLPSLLQYNQLPFPAGTQTPVQTYQTIHPQSSSGYQLLSMESSRFPSVLSGQTLQGPRCQTWHSPAMSMTGGCSPLPFRAATQTHGELTYSRSHHTQSFPGHGSSPSLPEYNQLPFLAGPQTPVQTYQTSHPQTMFMTGGYSQLPFHAATQTHGEPSYSRSNHTQSQGSFAWLPSSMEHSLCSSTVTAQTYERPDYQRIYSQSSSFQGRPLLSTEHNQLPFPTCGQNPVQTSQTQSHPQKACPADMFDVKTCQRKLAEHYQKTAKVPTTAWSSVLQVDLEKIYTRLSWVKQEQTTAGSSQNKKEEQTTAGSSVSQVVLEKIYTRLSWVKQEQTTTGSSHKKKEEQTPAGSSQKELNHYTEIFTEKTTNGVIAKRILVVGETGIGKTTFVKKLLVDWSNLEEAKMDKERKDALRKFDLVVFINLKEVSKCQTFKEVITRSGLFPEDDGKSVDDLLCYIRANQDKVLLVFDGYDEYRTGSEVEERYGNRSSSEIYKIFHGNILRDCTVLVTTRSSRADEIRGPADIQAEITGFNMLDREDFMRKMLDSQSDVDGLLEFLRESELNDLARVPLLSLFFCLLWKSEKEKLMELTERKAKLYQAIVKHILQHSHRRRSSSKASKLKETDYEEILAEIGKVALAGLLKGDLVFEVGQLPEKVRGEEGVIVGLFQFSEYGQSLEPTEMVSFIHKSIQEYLAAWYLIYSCVPKDSLGEIEQHTRTLENCWALENVFQFVCGLSDEGAKKVLEHFKSVRMSDPTLDFSKTIPDVETETEVPVCDVTYRHEKFSNLVYDSFQEVQSKVELFSNFLHCTGGVILVSDGMGPFSTRKRPITKLIPDVKVLTKLTHNFVFSFMNPVFLFWASVEDTMLYKLLDFLKCLQKPLRVTDSSEVLTVEDIIRKLYKRESCLCMFSYILCFLNGQFQFYITKSKLSCSDHARVLTESTTISVPCHAASLCSEASCLKFLSSLSCKILSNQTVKGLGAVIGNCKHLSRIELLDDDDSICYLLEQVRPSKCAVKIARSCIHLYYGPHLTSVGAVQLATLLSKFNNVVSLELDLRDCSAAAVETLVTSITHKTLNVLQLFGITSAASKTLGRSLPEMSSLQGLGLIGSPESTLEAEEMEALFGGFNKAMPLCRLTIEGFSVRSLFPLIKCLSFFPDLRELYLNGLNIDDQYRLLKSFGFLTELKVLIHGEASQASFKYTQIYDKVELGVSSLTPAVAAMLGRILPELPSLKSLEVLAKGSVLKAASMEALFGGFNKTMPLHSLMITGFYERGGLAPLFRSFMITGFCERGGLAPLFRSFRFFPNLLKLTLERVIMDEHDLRGLLESFQFIPNLQKLDLFYNPLGHAITSIVPHVIHLKKLQYLNVLNTDHSEEDLNYVRDTVQAALPELQVITNEDIVF